MATEINPDNVNSSFKEEADESTVIPVLEEVLHVSKQVTEIAKVKVTKRVINETEEIAMPLLSDDLVIERVAFGHYVDSAPQPYRYEQDTLVIPVLREEYVKRIVLVEEVRITKRVSSTEFRQDVTLMKEQVEVTREVKEDKE